MSTTTTTSGTTTTTTTCHKPILLVNVAQGGVSLAFDFRPPSAGGILQNDTTTDTSSSTTSTTTATTILEENETHSPTSSQTSYGWYYRQVVQDIHSLLSPTNLSAIVPDYNSTEGYKVSGMVWFHGWSDLQHSTHCQEYESNLIHLIHDLRTDLPISSTVPIVIGELGQFGTRHRPPYWYDECFHAIRNAQVRVPTRERAAHFVATAQYTNDSLGEYYQGRFHYYGRADTFVSIGRAFGYAMVECLQGLEAS